jgi:hypothetical protein
MRGLMTGNHISNPMEQHTMAKVNAKAPTRRGNKELHAQAIALSLHSWNNTVEDWQRLADCVNALGASAPAQARRLVESRTRSMRVLANPFK